MGTKISPPTPSRKTILRCDAVSACSAVTVALSSLNANSPFSESDSIYAGTTIDTTDGKVISAITPAAVMSPLFQSMMVVTSPIGEKAPPELAAMITSDA